MELARRRGPPHEYGYVVDPIPAKGQVVTAGAPHQGINEPLEKNALQRGNTRVIVEIRCVKPVAGQPSGKGRLGKREGP